MLVSTTCTYPEDAPNPLREDTIWDGAPTGATGPYGMAKRLLHEACAGFERQYGLSSAVVVLANLYGPGDHYAPETSHVVPMMARRYLEAAREGAEEVVNWGSGRATREFLHVEDAARALVLAAAVGLRQRPDQRRHRPRDLDRRARRPAGRRCRSRRDHTVGHEQAGRDTTACSRSHPFARDPGFQRPNGSRRGTLRDRRVVAQRSCWPST